MAETLLSDLNFEGLSLQGGWDTWPTVMVDLVRCAADDSDGSSWMAYEVTQLIVAVAEG